MTPSARHDHQPDAGFDGGDLDCGSGLLLLIRKHIDPLARGQLLEIRSTEISVDEDLPAWCRLTGNELVSWTKPANSAASWCARAGWRSAGPPAAGRGSHGRPSLPRRRSTSRLSTRCEK
jgi:5-methyltetrahydropteroyltriglutamate--homocysteine methyltransferase